MTRQRLTNRCRSSRCRALTLIEMTVSIGLVGVVLVASLHTLAAVRMGQENVYGRLSGHQLAYELMAEILQKDYADDAQIRTLKSEILVNRNNVVNPLGPETGENASGNRLQFDDIDDYHGWTASPPEDPDGTVMTQLAGWRREVTVRYVKEDDPAISRTSDEGAKLITVTVSYNNVPVATLVALRTIGVPLSEACCMPDRTCEYLLPSVCTSLSGTPAGADTNCYNTSCCTRAVVFEEFTEAKVESNRVTLDTPPGTVEGDLLIAAVVVDTINGPIDPPAGEGWTEIDQLQHADTDLTLGVWWKEADAFESPTHRFRWGSTDKCYAWMMRFTWHASGTPIDVAATNTGIAFNPVCPAVSTTDDDALILRIGGFDATDVTLDDTGLLGHWTITMDGTIGIGGCSGGAGYERQSAPGDSGSARFSLWASQEYVTFTIAIASEPCP